MIIERDMMLMPFSCADSTQPALSFYEYARRELESQKYCMRASRQNTMTKPTLMQYHAKIIAIKHRAIKLIRFIGHHIS